MRILSFITFIATLCSCSQLPPANPAPHSITTEEWARAIEQPIRIPARNLIIDPNLNKNNTTFLAVFQGDPSPEMASIFFGPSSESPGKIEVAITYSESEAENLHYYWTKLPIESAPKIELVLADRQMTVTIQGKSKTFKLFKNPTQFFVRH